MENFVVALAFAAGFLLTFGINLLIADVFEANRQRVRKRLDEELQWKRRKRTRNSLQYGSKDEVSTAAFFETDSRLTIRERFAQFVEESGLRIRPGQLAGLCVGITLAAGLLCWKLSGSWTLAALVAPFGGGLPILYASILRIRRLERLLSQLPDAFGLMSRSLRAGQTMSQALQAVADEFSAPIAEEFGQCYDQQNLGLSPEAALKDLARRTGLLELKIFVLAVMIHRQTGGNLAVLLEKLANVIRDRYRIHGMIKALTAEGRLQAAILLALPPGMFVVLSLVSPTYMATLYEYPMLLVAMFASMTIGGLWMKRIISFDF